MRDPVYKLIERTPVGRPAIRLHTRVKAWRWARRGGEVAEYQGLAIPPAKLRLEVAAEADPVGFLSRGERCVRALRDALERKGIHEQELSDVLDFGCGCGRMARHLGSAPFSLYGCDPSRAGVQWCNANLPWIQARPSDPNPPLPFASDSFDLVYAWSVFTHLVEGEQQDWMLELHRVLRPGGHLIMTLNGEAYARRALSPRDVERFEGGELVVIHPAVSGLNRCGAFHPPSWVKDNLLGGFGLREVVINGIDGAPGADLYVLRAMPSGGGHHPRTA